MILETPLSSLLTCFLLNEWLNRIRVFRLQMISMNFWRAVRAEMWIGPPAVANELC